MVWNETTTSALLAPTTNSKIAKPAWAEGLSAKGVYFEGFVDDADSVLQQYKGEAVTTYVWS